MEAIILLTKFFVPFLLVVVVSTLRHPRNLAENKRRRGVGNGAGIITLVFAAKKKHHFGFRTFPETRPPAIDKNGTPTSFPLATLNRSSSCHRRTKQMRHQVLRPADKPARPSSYQRRGRKAEREAKKKKEKNVFLITSLDSAARSSSNNGGQQQERGTVDMDKRVSLSRSFSPQFGVGSKEEKPIAAAGASERKRWIKRDIFRSLFLSFLSLRSVL